MSAPLYRTALDPQWIDYNGHLRDAYYGLIVSYATDALMEKLGLGAQYRARTRCTLYTTEMHIHYLAEIGQDKEVGVSARILASDHKRIHVDFELNVAQREQPAACAEVMLIHVHQGGKVVTQPFDATARQAIKDLEAATAHLSAHGPGSRRIELGRR